VPPKLFVAKRRALDVIRVIEKCVGIEIIIAEELVDAAVEIARAGAGDDIDLRTGGTARLRVVHASDDTKLADRVNAREREQREVGTSVDVSAPSTCQLFSSLRLPLIWKVIRLVPIGAVAPGKIWSALPESEAPGTKAQVARSCGY